MRCPACGNELTGIEIGEITVDACRNGCGGIWFDQLELNRLDEQHETAGESLLDIERDPAVKLDRERRRNCPSCDDMVLSRHFFSPLKEAEIDECPGCAGVWLDVGELALIRSQFATKEEREKAAEEYFDDLFGEELDKMAEEGEERLRKARKFANSLKFICPSYYIPGKQEWGAF